MGLVLVLGIRHVSVRIWRGWLQARGGRWRGGRVEWTM